MLCILPPLAMIDVTTKCEVFSQCAPKPILNQFPGPEKSNSNHADNWKHGQILNFRRKWRNNASERDFFSKHVRVIHLADLGVVKHFSKKKTSSFLSLSSFYLSLSLSRFFSLLVFSLLFSRYSLLLCCLSSFIFTCLFSPLSSSRFFSVSLSLSF